MATTKRTIGRYLLPVLAVMAFQLLSAKAPAAGTSGSKHPRELATRSAAPARRMGKVTISLNHRLRRGHLIVSLDDRPIFNEEFVKAALAISQTTTWDSFDAPAGKHKLTARVNGKNGKTYFSATYDFQLSRSKGAEIQLRLKGDRLIIQPTS